MRDGDGNLPRDSANKTGLASVERTLADGEPFGRYEFIADQLGAVYSDLLTLVSAESVAAKELLARLDELGSESRASVFRDSLLRRTIEDGACKIVMGIDTIDLAMLDDLLAAAAAEQTLLRKNGRVARLGPTPDIGYVWIGDQGDETLAGRRFSGEVLKRIPQFRIHSPTPEQVDTLTKGARLAIDVAPTLARSALSHNFMVVLGDFEAEDHLFKSFTLPGLPGVMILSPAAVSSDAAAAEALFHEAFHLKFLDIDYIRPLFRAGFRQETSPKITPVWHQDDPEHGQWPVDRVLTSMHVYLALAVFFERAEAREDVEDWKDVAELRAAQCRRRAEWLSDTAQEYFDYLTDSGRQFVSSVRAMVRRLPPAV
jgi:hypothetical protein